MAKAPPSSLRTSDPDSDPATLDPSSPTKRRARHRLIGAVVLSLLAAVTVPMLLSPEPTRGGGDAAIVIQGRDAPAPVVATPRAPVASAGPIKDAPGQTASVASPKDSPAPASREGIILTPPTPPEAPQRAESAQRIEPARSELAARPEPGRSEVPRVAGSASEPVNTEPRAPAAKPADKVSEKPPQKSADKPAEKPTEKPAEKAAEKSAEKSRDTRADASGKFLVQVGAFSQTASAQTALDRVKSAGLKGFSETIRTERGERIRVRVGPFSTRDAAEQARSRLKAAGLEAVLVSPQ
jgi:DedD protein